MCGCHHLSGKLGTNPQLSLGQYMRKHRIVGGFVTIVCIGFGWLQPTGGTQYHSAVMLGIRTFAVVNDQQRVLDELRCGLRMVRVKCKHEIVYTWTHVRISRI